MVDYVYYVSFDLWFPLPIFSPIIMGHKDHKKDYCMSHLVYIHAHQSINTSNTKEKSI
jgi:hypothetical protein